MFYFIGIYDELFCEIDFYTKFWRPKGISFKEVLIHRTGESAQTVVQSDIPEIPYDHEVKCSELNPCKKCGKKRYYPQYRGYYTRYKEDLNNYQIFKTREYFGDGGQSYRHIIMCQELRQELLAWDPKQIFKVYPLG